jgi:hypothetical protein
MRLSSYARGGYRRYLSWVANLIGYLSFQTYHAEGELLIQISSFQHPYVRNLRRSLRGRAFFAQLPQWHLRAVPIPLRTVDIFHLHFINELALDVKGTREFISRLQRAGVQDRLDSARPHPHDKDYELYDPIFALWAQATDGMIHHSHSGEEIIRARYRFRPDCEHVTIMEAFSRDHANISLREQRSSIERRYGLAPAPIRIALVGNPRVERKVIEFLEAVRRSSNHNIQVVCWSLRPSETPPTDPRIAIAEPWRFVDDEEITERLAISDLLAMPIAPDGEMLTTGLVGDAFGMGLGMLISSWDFLKETAADSGILFGDTVDEITHTLNNMSESTVAQAKQASLRIRAVRDWSNAGAQHLAFYERVHSEGTVTEAPQSDVVEPRGAKSAISTGGPFGAGRNVTLAHVDRRTSSLGR